MICELNKEKGYWILDDPCSREHRYDSKLSNALCEKLKGSSVVDLGCGFGRYVKNFRDNGIDCNGYDGNPHTENITDGICKILDLTDAFNLPRKYEFVLSLEVAEHIPEKYESVFVDNLHRHNTKGIILSWGITGQRGWGHFNCKSNEYVKDIFVNKLGYVNDLHWEKQFREVAELEWFKNTIMVFKK